MVCTLAGFCIWLSHWFWKIRFQGPSIWRVFSLTREEREISVCTSCCSITKSCPSLCDPIGCSTPGFPVLHYLLESAHTHVHWVDGHLILCRLLLLLPSIFPSSRVFSNESAVCIRQPKCCSFSFSISSSSEYSALTSFRIDWFDLLAVQGTLKSLLQHHSLKASILWSSAFFMVQLSHPYVTTGKTIALTVWAFVSKWCLCFLIHCLGLS